MTLTTAESSSRPFDREFATVQLLLDSTAETRAVDAFALCTIKMERQARRLFTFTVFQYPCFTLADASALKKLLAAEKNIYFESFIKGFDAIQPVSIATLIGAEHARLAPVLAVVRKFRNKIFHGQLTGLDLDRAALLNHAKEIQDWCRSLGEGADHHMGYSGFNDSFRKAADPTLSQRFKIQFSSTADYAAFLPTVAR